jgi:5-amino-6-(5-phosphoribosylamino)uracil reductase
MSADNGPGRREGAEVSFQGLWPDREELTLIEAGGGLRLADIAPKERPYLVLNMVTTLDGKVVVDGDAQGIGNEADQALLAQLRTQADVVMLGAETARVERIERVVADPALREQRRREGLAPEPLLCLVSRSLRLPSDLPALQAAGQRVLIVTASEEQLGEMPAEVEYLRVPPGRTELAPVFEELRTRRGIRSVLCEGGPTLNSSLFSEGLVDELFLTVSNKLVGGADALTIVAGVALAHPTELELVRVLESGGQLFLRLRVVPQPLGAIS